MGRVLAGASLAALVLTAAVTIRENVAEMRHGADHCALLAERERLDRIKAKLIEQEAALAGLESLGLRAARAGVALRLPGLPRFLTAGARDWPRFPEMSPPARN